MAHYVTLMPTSWSQRRWYFTPLRSAQHAYTQRHRWAWPDFCDVSALLVVLHLTVLPRMNPCMLCFHDHL